MHDRALNHALEAEGRLRVHLVGTRHDGGVVDDEILQAGAQVLDIGRAGAQNFRCGRVVQQRQQQVLHGDEFVACLPGLDEGHMQADFQFLRNHASSITHCSG